MSDHSKTRHCCVIGGSGFIGHHLVPLLLSSGRKVTVVGRRTAPARPLPAAVCYVAHDYGDKSFLADLLKDVDEVVNLAYSTVPKTSFEDPVQDILSNLPAAVNLFLTTSQSSVQRLILVSSGGTVYGKAESLPIVETHPTNPISPYGITKLAIEKYAIMYHNHTTLPVVVLRPGNAFGEEQRPFTGQGFIATAISSILSGKEITIYGKDGMIRDYMYVGDVAKGIMAALERGRPGECYNIGSGIGRNNREVLDTILPYALASGFKPSIRVLRPREFDVPANVLSATRLIQDTGWQMTTSFDDAIERMWGHSMRMASAQTEDLLEIRPVRILHTVEFYPPSIGGMQEVVRQLSERLALRGHDVTVATTRIPERTASSQSCVKIREFEISGNLVNGLKGEVKTYEDFLLSSGFDIITNFAAQQWATDIMLPVLDRINAKKVFVPTGFSRLYSREYGEYFASMKSWLKKYDVNVFLSESYRDIEFARQNGATNSIIIPNGAGEDEFLRRYDVGIRRQLGISEKEFFILHVGSHTGEKGHQEAIEIFKRARIKHATFLMIGNFYGPAGDEPDKTGWKGRLIGALKTPVKKLLFLAVRLSGLNRRKLPNFFLLDQSRNDGSFRGRMAKRINFFFYLAHLDKHGVNCPRLCRVSEGRFNRSSQSRRESKRLLIRSMSREETVAAYQEADLFLFPSNIECSPLVLFECMASRTPFLTTDVGNSAEIIKWSGGAGIVLPTSRNEVGDAKADVKGSAKMLERIFRDAPGRREMADNGFEAWQERFGWEKIAGEYEALYSKLLSSGGRNG